MQIRLARPIECEGLSRLAVEARSHWGHDVQELAGLQEDLEIDWTSPDRHPAFLAEDAPGQVLGFYRLMLLEDGGPVMDHLWVRPSAASQGVGRELLAHALQWVTERGFSRLDIDADPGAERFFLAHGAVRVGERPAPLHNHPGRVRPQLYLVPNSLSPASPRPGTM
jgi:GNAT superfamily N-acetyltransferase